MPNLFIIAGCNGAGKTTASFSILPAMLHCKEFVNADEIAKGLSPFQPESVAFHAGRIMLERIEELINLEINFAFETTLTTLSYMKTIEFAKNKGYTVTLLFFWLSDVNLAIERVKTRVNEGGHNIPEEVIRRRYYRGIKNFFTKFMKVSDLWMVINNSGRHSIFVAEGRKNIELEIYETSAWQQIKNQ